MVSGEMFSHPGVQVRVRAATHAAGFAKAEAVARALDEDVYDERVTVDGTAYLLHSVSRTADVFALGKDTPTSKRSVFTINALVALGRA
jgi:hypothetical protein